MMPVDPVCGCAVDESTPFKGDIRGETYYFCSEDCLEEFVVEDDDVLTTWDYPDNMLER